MCTSPITIENPNFRQGKLGFNRIHNTIDKYIQVPCGHCRQCIATKQSYFLQKYDVELMDNELFFFTLTYKDDFLPRFPDIIPEFAGLPCFRISDFQKMIKRIRKRVKFDFKYVLVCEYGGAKHRPHYHGLLSLPRSLIPDIFTARQYEKMLWQLFFDEWRINLGSTRKPKYEKLFDYYNLFGRRNFDFHYVEHFYNAEQSLPYYVSKYLFKYDSYFNSLYRRIRALDDNQQFLYDVEEQKFLLQHFRPRLCFSKDFGFAHSQEQKDYIEHCVNSSLSMDPTSFPQYSYKITGKKFQLAPIYRNKFLSLSQVLSIYDARDHEQDSMSVLHSSSKSELESSSKQSVEAYKDLQLLRSKLDHSY